MVYQPKDNLSVLVTIADLKNLNQAKQLFASAYYNANWSGDYLLLAYRIKEEELNWFVRRGIKVRHVKSIDPLVSETRQVMLAKFELFRASIKQWKYVLYLDSDVIIRGSLEGLKYGIKFGGVKALRYPYLKSRIYHPVAHDPPVVHRKFNQLLSKYNINQAAINGGLYVFSTTIITNETYNDLLHFYENYRDIFSIGGEEGVVCTFFQKYIEYISPSYNVMVMIMGIRNTHSTIGKVYHFCGPEKPWHKENPYYNEWSQNLIKAEYLFDERVVRAVENYSILALAKMNILLFFLIIIFRIKQIIRNFLS